jgi:hypothetical protein
VHEQPTAVFCVFLCAGECDTANGYSPGIAEALCNLGNFYISGSCSKWRANQWCSSLKHECKLIKAYICQTLCA